MIISDIHHGSKKSLKNLGQTKLATRVTEEDKVLDMLRRQGFWSIDSNHEVISEVMTFKMFFQSSPNAVTFFCELIGVSSKRIIELFGFKVIQGLITTCYQA